MRWFSLSLSVADLSSLGASLAPCFRFDTPLIKPDVRIDASGSNCQSNRHQKYHQRKLIYILQKA